MEGGDSCLVPGRKTTLRMCAGDCRRSRRRRRRRGTRGTRRKGTMRASSRRLNDGNARGSGLETSSAWNYTINVYYARQDSELVESFI